MHEYSATFLTIPTDKLVAISGLAKSFACITGDTYLAGMWRKDLEVDLLWYNRHIPHLPRGSRLGSRPIEWRAPTWSWASIDGSVIHDCLFRPGSQYLTVQDVVLEYSGEDKMGLITGGWLDLRGTLKPMTLFLVSIEDPEGVSWTMLEPRVTVDTFKYYGVHLDVPTTDPSAFNDDNIKGNLFYMLGYHCSWTTSTKVATLLILKMTDRCKALFQRIGLLRILLEEEDSEAGLEVLGKHDMSEEGQRLLPCLEYHEDGTHTIRII